MRNILLLFLCVLPMSVGAADHWYIVIDRDTGIEIKSYGPVSNVESALTSSGHVRIEITKQEYEADKDVAPSDRLKAIPQMKTRLATAVTNAYEAKADAEWNKAEVTIDALNAKLPIQYKVKKSDWIAAWKASNTNLIEALKPSKEIK